MLLVAHRSLGSSLRSGSISCNPAAFNFHELLLLQFLVLNLQLIALTVFSFETLTLASGTYPNLGTELTERTESDATEPAICVVTLFSVGCYGCFSLRSTGCEGWLEEDLVLVERVCQWGFVIGL